MSEHIIPASSPEIGFCPVVSVEPVETEDFYDLEVPDIHNYFDANGINHQNSGKNMTMESAVCYFDYSVQCLAHPQRFFWGIEEPRFMDCLNFSFVKEDHAKDIFFDSMKNTLRACKNPDTGRPWFEEQGVDLRDGGIGDIKTKMITLPRGIRNRCIVASREGFEGSNILLAVFDEPSRAVLHPWKNEHAHELLEKVQINQNTRFGNMGKTVIFSYPEAVEDDLCMETVLRAEGGEPGVWASRKATFEVNPLRSEADFADLAKSSPERYATIILCQPPASRTGFYREHPEMIDAAFANTLKPVVEIATDVVERQVPGADGKPVARRFTTVRLVRCIPDALPRSLGADPGKTGDSFCLALARGQRSDKTLELVMEAEEPGETMREAVTGQPVLGVGPDGRVAPMTAASRKVERRLDRVTVSVMPVVDAILEIRPIIERRPGQRHVTYPIDFVAVKDLILQLKQRFSGLRTAQFDSWNSAQLVSELVRAGINAVDLPFSNAQQLRLYRQHRALTYAGWIQHVPHDGARREFHDLQDLGHRVDHKRDGSKDLSDSIVLAADGVLAARGGGYFLV